MARKSAQLVADEHQVERADRKQRAHDERVALTLEYWRTTYDRRVELRSELPYEHTTAFLVLVARLADAYYAAPPRSVVKIGRKYKHTDLALRDYLSLFETIGDGVVEGAFDIQVINRLDGPRIRALGSTLAATSYLAARQAHAVNPEMFRSLCALFDGLELLASRPEPAKETQSHPDATILWPRSGGSRALRRRSRR